MNNLLFTALLIALIYYFFYYLPQKKSIINPPSTKLTQTQFTQTDPHPIIEDTLNGSEVINCPGAQSIPDPQVIQQLAKELQQKEQTITGLNNSYKKLETKTKSEIDKLKEQLKDKDQKIKELSETEKTIDQLIKGIQDLNQNLE